MAIRILSREAFRRHHQAAGLGLLSHVPQKEDREQKRRRPRQGEVRSFHSTPPRPIVPIIIAGVGVAIFATGVRYLLRAGKRMKEIEAEEAARKAEGGGGDGDGGGAASNVNATLVGPAFGVDFGTTSLRLAMANAAAKAPEIVENREGFRWTPAVVNYAGESPIVGTIAKSQLWQSPANTITGLQQLVGVQFGSPELVAIREKLGYKLIDMGGGELGIEAPWLQAAGGAPFLPVNSAVVDLLTYICALKDHKVGHDQGAAFLSVPPHFDVSQRSALSSAATLAGLTVGGTIEEPVAAVEAALELGFLPEEARSGLVAVLDMGGRSLTCSVVDVRGGIQGEGAKLVSTERCRDVGGDYLEAIMVQEMDRHFSSKNKGLGLLGDPLSLTRLHMAAEAATMELSKCPSTSINLPYITADQTGPKHLEMDLSRAAFDRLIEEHLSDAMLPCGAALANAGIPPGRLSAVLLVGGCSRVPAVQAITGKVLKMPPIVPLHSEEMVVLGAAIAARKEVYGS